MDYLTHLDSSNPKSATTSDYGLEYTFPVKYYDFHVYYFAHNSLSLTESDNLRDKFLNDFQHEGEDGTVIVKKLPDTKVIGPHATQFWEVDVCKPEVFVKVLSWFQLYHGSLSVLIHPQTGNDLEDHTTRALWLGKQLPLFTDVFPTGIPEGIPQFGVKGGERVAAKDFT